MDYYRGIALREEVTPSTKATYVASREHWMPTGRQLQQQVNLSPTKMMQGNSVGMHSPSTQGSRYVTTKKVPFGSTTTTSNGLPRVHRYSSPPAQGMFVRNGSPYTGISSGRKPDVTTVELKSKLKTSLTLLKSKMSATIPVNNVPRLEERHGGSNTMGGPQYGNTRRHSAQPRYSDDSPKEWYRQLSGRASASPESLGRGLVRRQRHSSGDTGPSTSEYGERVNRRTTETKDSPLVVDRKKSMPRIEKGVVVIGEVGVGEYPEEQMRMVKCQQCGRSFNEESIGKHEGVCRKVFKEKRREFDIVANRLHGFENKDQLIRKAMQEKRRGPQKAKPTKWKQQSEAFRAAIASCRSTDPYERQVAAAKFAELQAEHERQHMVKCPHCGRTFHDEASKRHIPICQKTFATGGGRLLKGRGSVAHSTAGRRDSRR